MPRAAAHSSYHFTIGAPEDPIGFCAAVCANSPAEALERLRDLLAHQHLTGVDLLRSQHTAAGLTEYARAYLNTEAIGAARIDRRERCTCGLPLDPPHVTSIVPHMGGRGRRPAPAQGKG